MIENILKTDDLWHKLQNENKPILLYGMGDGADKVLNVCEEYGIEVSGVFASDGFAKKKIFRGFEVTTYSQAYEKFGDFTVLLSFATSLDTVLKNIKSISLNHTLYCPDVPVFGKGLFNREFVQQNYDKFKKVYSLLSDDVSKNNYVNIILGKLTGECKYLYNAETTPDEAYKHIICPKNTSHYIDIGAYNGDTIREYLSYAQNVKVTAFEPDAKNYKKLIEYANAFSIDTSHFHNVAAWDKKETLTFYSRSGRNSSTDANRTNLKTVQINADKCDSYIDTKVDYVKIDAEGADKKVIDGLENTLRKYKPTLSCAVYHRNEDMFEIPNRLFEIYGKCKMYIRHFRYLPAWDTNVYIVPDEE